MKNRDNEQMLELVKKCSGGDCVFFKCPTLVRYFEEYEDINGEDDGD